MSAAFAQTPDVDAPAAPAPTPKSYWRGVKYSGLLDVYTNLNFNHPASDNNTLRNFDVKANSFDLNYGRFSLERAAEPIGFRVDVGLGRATKIIHGAEQAGQGFRYLQQFYVSLKPPGAKGLQLDFGKFNTSAGAEVTETHLNWNYSRSLLFANGPYYHFGLRSAIPVTKSFTAGVQLLNGWNNIKDNNSGKTLGFTGALTKGKISWFNNYYVGPEKTNLTEGYRHFYDTVVAVNPTERVNFLTNFDYGVDRRIGGGADAFYGVAFATRVMLTKKVYVSPRVEYYNDRDGFITGTSQQLKEFTLTGEYKWREGILTRLEFRRDWSSAPFFDRGNGVMNYPNQTTILLGIVAYLNPRS